MATTQKPRAAHQSAADTTEAVDKFMLSLEHPHRAEIAALRKLILDVDDSVSEGIKWNAPSYRTHEYFATTNLRMKAGVGIILHLGAKVRVLPKGGIKIDDPSKLLRWLAPDRAVVEFQDAADLKAKQKAFQALLRLWIGLV